MGNDLEILVDSLVKSAKEKIKKRKFGEEGVKLEWYLKEQFPKSPPTIRKKELNEAGDVLTYHLNVPIPLSFDSIKKLEKAIAFTIKHDCEVLQSKNYEVFVRFFEKQMPSYCRFKEEYLSDVGENGIVLGFDRKGLVSIKLEDTVHWLVAGTTGSGKSTVARCIMTSILMNVKDVNMYIIDQKRVEFVSIANRYDIPVAYDPDTINVLFKKLQKESNRRTELMLKEDVNDAKELKNPPPPVVVIIDELAEMNGKTDLEKENQDILDSLVRLSRACNFHILCFTQKPSAKLWDKFSSTREMLSTRICLRVNDETTSTMVLDSPICASISTDEKGRGVLLNGLGEMQMIQFCDISYKQMKIILFNNLNITKETNNIDDYIDIEGNVSNAENENCIAIAGVADDLIDKVNKEKDIANIKYRKEDKNERSGSIRNDRRGKENCLSKRQTVQREKSEKILSGKGQSNNGVSGDIQSTNSKSSYRHDLF